MIKKNYDYLFNILILGEEKVGKSGLISRYIENKFKGDYIPTIGKKLIIILRYIILLYNKYIGLEFLIKKIVINEKMVKLQINDFSGQKKFSSIINAYYKGANGIILVYDVTEESSFNALNNWLTIIKDKAPQANIILVGQKCDLNERVISEDKIKELTEQFGIEYFETSAKIDYNINEVFDNLIQQCMYNNYEAADIGAV